jgi:hypothetical protein
MSGLEGFLFGLFGAFLSEVLGLFKLRREASLAALPWLKSKFYWVITVLMILIGGGLAWVYLRSGAQLNPLLAVNIGASAPLILSTLVAQTEPVGLPKIN